MAITKIILQQMVTMDQNSITASKYPKYTVVLSNSISSITAGELTTAIESSKASAAAAKQSEINAKQSELNAKDSENEAEISAASSQQSATQSASSATASANSAKAAKTSETNAKASETAAKTSETNAKASETAAKTSETNANSSKTAAAASASAAKTSETNAAASASAAKTSETNANSSKTAAANSAGAAKTSETNAKTSETNAAASATKAENAASGMRDSIGLGNAPRNCPDISGNPSAYIGFMRIMSTAVGFPSIASGESSLTGFISQVDGSPAYTGVFQGWASRSLYTYRWASNIGPQWTRHARKNEVDRLVQLSSETHLLNPGDNAKIIITSNKLWGAYDIENRTYIPLAVGQGGTGGRSAAEARTNLQLNRFQRSSDTRTIVCSTDVQKDGCYLQIDADGQWGAFNPTTGKWQPLAIAQGGTGALNTSDARRNLGVMHRSFTSLSSQNLNDLNGDLAGFYHQAASAGATPELNYPIKEAGNLIVLQNGANGTAGCCQIYITHSTNRIYERSYNPSSKSWSAWGSILNSYDPSYCRQLIELGSQNAPLFAGLALTGYSDSTVAAGGIINSYLRATDGTQRVRMRLYPEKPADGVAAVTLQVMGEDTGPSYKTFHFKHNGELYVPNEINTETIAVRNLTVTQRNLGIPTTGFMGDYQTINAPAGAVDGKYYPVIIYTGGTNGYGITPVPIFVRTPGRSASHEMNNNVFSGYVTCGGWSDSPTMAHGMFTTYDPNELGILCIKGSNKNYAQHIAVYVHYKAFPVNIMTDPKVEIIVPTEDYVLGTNGVKFKFGVTDAGDGNTEGNVKNILNFTGGGSGYYSTHPFRQGLSNNFALTNNLSTGDAFSATAPSFTFNGSVVGANSYSARGDAVTKNTYTSQLVNSADSIVGQSEFRATEEAGQIIVRDMTSSASHKFFNFNKDGTFSAPSGILSSTGIDWNTQHNTTNKFYGIAGQVNSPENNVVFGGVHIGFSGNFATQLAGRGNRYYLRSIESGTIGAWNRIITDQYADFKTQIFANKNGEAITIKSTVNDNSESGYIAGRNNTNTRLWYVGKSGPQETVVIRNEMNGNQILLRDGAGDISLETKDGNKVVYANASNFRLINSNGKYTRLVTSGTSTHAISLDNWGTTTRPTVFECKYENPSTSANVSWIFYGQVNTDGSRVFQVNGAVNCVTLNQSSDRDLKDNIKPIKDATNALRKMNGYTYTLKEDGLPYAGVIAQEVMEALPEAVSGFTKYTDLEGPTLTGEQLVGEERFYSVDYGAITGLLVQVSRESDSRITALESEVSDLKKQIADLTLVVNSLLANKAQ